MKEPHIQATLVHIARVESFHRLWPTQTTVRSTLIFKFMSGRPDFFFYHGLILPDSIGNVFQGFIEPKTKSQRFVDWLDRKVSIELYGKHFYSRLDSLYDADLKRWYK